MYQFKNIKNIREFLVTEIPVTLEIPGPIGHVTYFHNGDQMDINLDTLELEWSPIRPGSLSTSKLSMRFHQWLGKGYLQVKH